MTKQLKNADKLRIAMLGHKSVPSRQGGVEVVVEELSTRMVELGCSVTLFNRSSSHVSGKEFDTERMDEYKGITIKYVPTIERKGFAAATSSIFGSILSALGRFDVVHFHAEGPCAMLWIPKLLGKRCIATIHGLDHQRSDKWGWFSRTYILWGEKVAARYADEIIVLSRNVQDYFKNTYNRDTHYIPNGVNRPQTVPADLITKRFGLKKDSYILFVGRLVPEKGIAYLISAFANIKTDKNLVIAGGSSDSDGHVHWLHEMAASDKRIIFTGFVQGQALAELYSNAYFFVLPSDVEGMPLVLLEAMSYSNCCLTSDIPECTEVTASARDGCEVTEYSDSMALTFNKGSIGDLCSKMQMLLANPELVNKYKSASADFICQKCNWDDVVKKTLEFYYKER